MADWWTQTPFTEKGYGRTLPKDILLLLADEGPTFWYLIVTTNKEWAKYAKEKMSEKKIAFSFPVIFVSGFEGTEKTEKYSRLPNMRKHGKYKSITRSIIYSGKYCDGEKTGVWKMRDRPGWLMEEKNYHKGCLEGLYIKYHNTGDPYIRENYKNGKRHGLHEEWHLNGILAVSGHYSEGSRVGKWNYFDLKGEPST